MSARERIIQYHNLCAVGSHRDHVMATLTDADMRAIFAQTEVAGYFKTVDGRLVVRETVVGGKEKSDSTRNIATVF